MIRNFRVIDNGNSLRHRYGRGVGTDRHPSTRHRRRTRMTAKIEKQNMLSGEPYRPGDPELAADA
jgi:hypothetical protein